MAALDTEKTAAPSSARSFFSALHVIRVPIILSLAVAYILAGPEQVIELYRAIAQDLVIKVNAADQYRELAVCAVGLLAMALAMWGVTRMLAARVPPHVPVSTAGRVLLACAPVVLFLVVMMSAALGLYRAQTPPVSDAGIEAAKLAFREARDLHEDTPPIFLEVVDTLIREISNSNDMLLRGAAVVVGAALLIALVLAIWQVCSAPPSTTRIYFSNGRAKWLLVCAFGGAFALAMIWPVAAPQTIGPVGVFSAFIVLLTFTAGLLSFYGDRYGVPLLSGLLVYAVAISLFNLNDNHKIYGIGDSSGRTSGLRPALNEEFERWFEARPDRKRFEENNIPYPVYVVAAPGGGVFAAFHAASQLGSLQDHCPTFSQHTFAISGVSGGSVGAAVFASFLAATANPAKSNVGPGACVAKDWRPADQLETVSIVDLSDRVLSEDYLSPLLTALLFPDFLQRFLPVPISAFDRARRFDQTLEHSVDKVLANEKLFADKKGIGQNLLKKPYVEHWSADGNVPALIINTTEVDTGRRRLISPFVFGTDKGLTFLPVWGEDGKDGQDPGIRMPLSTAVGLSARFPWISPAGWFHDVDGDRSEGEPHVVRLVDGAYFENSGVATALDLIRAMEQAAQRRGFADRIQINLIALTRDIERGRAPRGLNELAAPVRALLNARTARGPITIQHAEDSLDGKPLSPPSQSGATPLRLRKIRLKDMSYPTPLGWRLSTISLYLIRAQNGKRSECTASERFEQTNPDRFDGDCVYASIARELSAGPP